jgi:hypothetical protein
MPYTQEDQTGYGGHDGYGNVTYPEPVEVYEPEDDFYNSLTALYQKYYKRNPNQQEWTAHRGNPGGLEAIEEMLKKDSGWKPDEGPPPPTPTPPTPRGGDPDTKTQPVPIPGVPAAYSSLAPAKGVSAPGSIGNSLFPSSSVDPMVSGRNAIVQSILNRPAPLDQKFQDQLFEAQKSSQLGYADQMRGQVQQDALRRGIRGGQVDAALGGINSDMSNQLLAGRRDIATQAALQNRQAELTAAGLANQIMLGDTGLDYQKWQMEEDARQKVFAANELQRQFNERMGFDWAGLNESRNNSFLQFLINSGAV